MMKAGINKGYDYIELWKESMIDHNGNIPKRLVDDEAEEAFSGQNYFPEGLSREHFYQPRDRGFEREIAKRLAYWDKLRRERTR